MNEEEYYPVEDQQSMLDMFDDAGADKSITTEHLDKLVQEMVDSEAAYKEAKSTSNRLYEEYQTKRAVLISTLQQAGKKKYVVDGLGTASVVEKLQVRTPKTPEEKTLFFEWLRKNHGDDGLLAYQTVNSRSLTSLYNTEFEAAKLDGTAAEFKIDGIEAPTVNFELSFRKGR